MGLEVATYISDLVATNPLGSDQKSTADDHLRLIKSTIKASFPNVNGAVNPTPTEFNYLVGVTSGIQAQIAAKGAITGQTWTGSHNFPTQSQGNNSTLAATTAYVDTGLALKGSLAGATWTGTQNFTGSTITATTQATGDNSTKVATTAYADAARAIGDFIRLSTATASASTAIDFTSVITSTYDVYMIEIINVKPATNGALLYLLTSTNNGSTFDAGSYLGVNTVMKATGVTSISAGTGNMILTDGISSSREGASGFIYITTPTATARPHVRSEISYTDSAGTVETFSFTAAYRDVAAAINAVRLYMSTGNIASGTFNFYGRKKS